MKSLNIVQGCTLGCPYCYAYHKFRNKIKNNFNKPTYYPEYFDKVSKKPDVYICSLLGDIMEVTDENLIDIFTHIQKKSHDIFFLQSKLPIRYFKFLKDVWMEEVPRNVFFGTSVENDNYNYRLENLYKLKEINESIHLWVENEPLMGDCSKGDYSLIEYHAISAIGFDQIYKSTIDGHILKKHELWKDKWIESLYNNPTVDINKIKICNNIKKITSLDYIKKHKDFDIYKILHEFNNINNEINPLF